MSKLIFSKLADALEGLSRIILERPFAARERNADDFVREIVRTMQAEKMELLDGFYVPDHYTLYLPTSLYEHYKGYIGECLCEQIANEVLHQIERWDYEIQSPVEVKLADGQHTDKRRIEVHHGFCDEDAARAAEYRVLSTQDPREHFRQGRKLQAEQRFEEAILEFEAALRLSRRMVPAHFNLGSIAFQQCRYEDAVRHYQNGLEFDPEQMAAHADIAKAHEMLGEWSKAMDHLKQAAALQPGHPVIRRRLARVREESQLYGLLRTRLETEFVRAENTSQSEYVRLDHFALSCSSSLPPQKRLSLETMLESIYSELGATFSTYPRERTEVVVQPNRSHKSVRLPPWAAASYDGRIHLVWNPSRPIELAVAYILLRHEFAHVLIAELTQGNCPGWLNEGLAEYSARKLMASEEQMLRQAVHQEKAIRLEELERGFQKIPTDQIRLAYVQSYTLAAYLVDRFGMSRVVRLLRQLGDRKSWREVTRDELGLTPAQLEADWLDTIRRRRL